MRFVLGSLSETSESEKVEPKDMPELEQWILHRLSELDERVRKGYSEYDFQGVFQSVFTFATVELSSFYFDIRKDVLYCDGDTLERRSSQSVLDHIFLRLTSWLAPVLVFTMEEVWLERYPGDNSSIHLTDMPNTPKAWRNEELAKKWAIIRQARRAVTAALEVQRTEKVIGSSLEAYPVIHLEDQKTFEILDSIPFADICITSSIKLSLENAPETAFSTEEIKGIKIDFQKASGEKCQRCWKILPEVSLQNPVCGRCNEALQGQDDL